MQVKIKEVKDSGRTFKDGKKIFDVWIENDSKKYTCFDSTIESKLGTEIEATITEKVNGTFTNYILTPKKQGGFGGGYKPNNKALALQSACTYLANKTVKKEDITELAKYFHEWLES